MFGFIFFPIFEATVTEKDDEHEFGLWPTNHIADDWNTDSHSQAEEEFRPPHRLGVAFVAEFHKIPDAEGEEKADKELNNVETDFPPNWSGF